MKSESGERRRESIRGEEKRGRRNEEQENGEAAPQNEVGKTDSRINKQERWRVCGVLGGRTRIFISVFDMTLWSHS